MKCHTDYNMLLYMYCIAHLFRETKIIFFHFERCQSEKLTHKLWVWPCGIPRTLTYRTKLNLTKTRILPMEKTHYTVQYMYVFLSSHYTTVTTAVL